MQNIKDFTVRIENNINFMEFAAQALVSVKTILKHRLKIYRFQPNNRKKHTFYECAAKALDSVKTILKNPLKILKKYYLATRSA